MAEWMTAEQVAVHYVVGEQRLREYGERGNLAMRRCADGRVLFDGEGAARFFRVRGAAALGAAPGGSAKHLGVLGVARLGELTAPQVTMDASSSGGRDGRKRALRCTAGQLPVPAPVAEAG
ncbi:hypothetical protein WME91_44950 [Sorangium sp. So ce269]